MGTTIALRCAGTAGTALCGPSCNPHTAETDPIKAWGALQQRLTHPGPVAVSNSTPSARGIPCGKGFGLPRTEICAPHGRASARGRGAAKIWTHRFNILGHPETVEVKTVLKIFSVPFRTYRLGGGYGWGPDPVPCPDS